MPPGTHLPGLPREAGHGPRPSDQPDPLDAALRRLETVRDPQARAWLRAVLEGERAASSDGK
jgi:hypothetical protein